MNAIYNHHYMQKKIDKVVCSESSAPRCNPSGHLLTNDGFISFVQVIESAAKIRYMESPDATCDDSQEHCKWYIQQLEDSRKIADSAGALASAISVLHLCLSQIDSRYSYVLQEEPTSAPVLMVYEQQRNNYIKVHEYTSEQFTDMCAAMRGAFLCWKKIAKYLPKEAKQQVSPQIGARELLSAVMRRYGSVECEWLHEGKLVNFTLILIHILS